jgi:hypothetical protein
MNLKKMLAPFLAISMFIAVSISPGGMGRLFSTPAHAGYTGGDREFVLALSAMVQIYVFSVAIQILQLPGPNVVNMPLGNGSSVSVFVNNGKVVGYMRNY